MKSLAFILLCALGVSSCKDDSDTVTPISTCLLDSYGDTGYRFEAKYNGDKIIEQTSFYGEGSTIPEYQYKYEYPQGKVVISIAYVKGGGSLSVAETYKLNSEGLPVEITNADGVVKEKFIYAGGKLAYSVDKPNNDSLVYTYDAAGKNIASIKYHAYKNGAWIFSYQESFKYDDKINPFYKLFGYEGDDVYLYFFNANNVISLPEENEVYTYTYNDKGYPISGTVKYGSKTESFFFTYSCQ